MAFNKDEIRINRSSYVKTRTNSDSRENNSMDGRHMTPDDFEPVQEVISRFELSERPIVSDEPFSGRKMNSDEDSGFAMRHRSSVASSNSSKLHYEYVEDDYD